MKGKEVAHYGNRQTGKKVMSEAEVVMLKKMKSVGTSLIGRK